MKQITHIEAAHSPAKMSAAFDSSTMDTQPSPFSATLQATLIVVDRDPNPQYCEH